MIGALAAALLAGLLASAAVPAVNAAPPSPARFDFAATPGVLSRNVVPQRYELLLQLDPKLETFDGEVTIHLRLDRPMAQIELHAQGLESRGARIVSAGGARRGLQVQPDSARSTWRLVPEDGGMVTAGEHRVELRWRGRVQRTGEGLFRVDHRVLGQPARMLATQLQAIHARTLLPVFDEPVFRAVFDVAVRAPSELEVVSNMPRTERLRGERGIDLHRFAPTPPMPAYLLALAVGRFDVLEDRLGDLPLRMLTAPGKREQARFAMQSTRALLPWFADLFGQPPPMPKLDQLAVPGTREGAMEDWGLISYAEELLLYDPGRSAPDSRRTVFALIAHELSHQWFGNLVSIASWNELWLNEAFATWMEHKASERFHPEWQPALLRRARLDAVMELDAGPATRAVRPGPVAEARVAEVFDGITYLKGAALLAMLESWLGEGVMQRGLAAYVAERRLAPATAGDLWHHLGQAAGRDVSAVATSWTDQPGMPLVEADASCVDGRTQLRLRQSRLLLPGAPDATPASPTLWRIPLRVARGDETRALLLEAAESRVELAGCDARPLLVNAGGAGWLRVSYSPALLARLHPAFVQLPTVDRMVLLSDSFALLQSGRLAPAAYLRLLAQLPTLHDASRAPLFSLALQHLDYLDDALFGSPAQARLRAAGRALLGPELARLGWSPRVGEDAAVGRLRGELIERLAAFDDSAVLAEAQARLVDLLGGSRRGAQASIRASVLKAVGTQANEAEFRALLTGLRNSEDDEDRGMYAAALAAGRHPGRAARLLEEAVGGRLPSGTATSLPGLVAGQPELAELAYAFSQRHFDALARLSGSLAMGQRPWLLPGAVGNSNDAALAERMAAEQRRRLGDAGVAAAARVLAQVRQRAALREREAGPLAAALEGWIPLR